ncbi:phosphoribosylformylglycinamidine cyclo-ligase [Pseudalkalibacillus berkeleyi]|uniref:Phosphoribosylformylglycinamidine cyclo-ligase n=1 Tax=Pseudalkalibacillus berkeleyi TaxID=1069813 RepID=A0ABS9H5A3_9BACL|nr:phosphoribosylformylglycinamidine cyclo-ligase [Pseudalkalibacillus berkeleyi]MCF6139140.1 phosphoribosylformylglycinamidine cyclo-ligase [Pseudalkalibacillus berkeleyi]
MAQSSSAYKQAGVDVEAGYEAVNRMKKHVKSTIRPEVMGGLGGFGGMFDLSKVDVKEPVLISGTDGVGTKLMLAFQMDQHDTIGIDAVAMCVNDIVAQGAEPLYFLDYIACGKLEPEKIEQIVKGIADGCKQAGAALIGGETAEMPGMYDPTEYDLAGFTVGVAEKSKLITPEKVNEGDVLIGLASSGIHSNGYSLVRKVLLEQAGYQLNQTIEQLGQTLGEELLTPTKIYVKPVLEVIRNHDVSGIAHITGGGFNENIPRMLPEGLSAEVELGSWPVPPIFSLIQSEGGLTQEDMLGTFNMGIGMVLAVKKEESDAIIRTLIEQGERAYRIGKVKAGEGISFLGGDLD